MAVTVNLAYNEYITNLTGGLHLLLESAHNADVTFAVEGQLIKAHQIVLSMFSSYFKELFEANPCPHPIFFLKDVSYRCLKDILTFIYAGNVQIVKEELQTFLATATALKVKGLEDVPESGRASESPPELRPEAPVIYKNSLKRRFDDIDGRKSDKRTHTPQALNESKLLPAHTETETLKFEEDNNDIELGEFRLQISMPETPHMELSEDGNVGDVDELKPDWFEDLTEDNENIDAEGEAVVKFVKSRIGNLIVVDNKHRYFGKRIFGGNNKTKRLYERYECALRKTSGCRAVAWLTDDHRIALTNDHSPQCTVNAFKPNDIILSESIYRLTTKTGTWRSETKT